MAELSVHQARELARTKLAEALPRRWVHVQAVAAQAEKVAPALGSEGDLLVASAWLHDIGYAPDLVDSGFHPLDGARFLRGRGVDERVVRLVAHHSCARIEARLRDLDGDLLAEFQREEPHLEDALCYCDMTTGPDGQSFAINERLAEIRNRYGAEHLVTCFIIEAEPEIKASAQRVEERLEAQRM